MNLIISKDSCRKRRFDATSINTPQFAEIIYDNCKEDLLKEHTFKILHVKNKRLPVIENIINDFNFFIGEKVINDSYRFVIDSDICAIRPYKEERNFNKWAINFGESNKNKKALIEKGIEPAKQIGTNEDGSPILSNKNLWIVYYTEDFFPRLKVTKLASFNDWSIRVNVTLRRRFIRALREGKTDLNQYQIKKLKNHGRSSK